MLMPLQRLVFERVEVIAVTVDLEAGRFANKVMDCLNAQGYDVKSIVNTSRPAIGQYVELVDGATRGSSSGTGPCKEAERCLGLRSILAFVFT